MFRGIFGNHHWQNIYASVLYISCQRHAFATRSLIGCSYYWLHRVNVFVNREP